MPCNVVYLKTRFAELSPLTKFSRYNLDLWIIIKKIKIKNKTFTLYPSNSPQMMHLQMALSNSSCQPDRQPNRHAQHQVGKTSGRVVSTLMKIHIHPVSLSLSLTFCRILLPASSKHTAQTESRMMMVTQYYISSPTHSLSWLKHHSNKFCRLNINYQITHSLLWAYSIF